MAVGGVHKDAVPGRVGDAADGGGAIHDQAGDTLLDEASCTQGVVLVEVEAVEVGIGEGVVDAIPGAGADGGRSGEPDTVDEPVGAEVVVVDGLYPDVALAGEGGLEGESGDHGDGGAGAGDR